MASTAEQDTWIGNVIGIDIAALRGAPPAQASAAKNGHAETEATNGTQPPPSAAKGKGILGLFKKSGKGSKAGKSADTSSPTDAKLLKKLETLMEETAKLRKMGFNTRQMVLDAADVGAHAVAAEAETDKAEKEKSLQELRTQADDQIAHVRALAKSLKDVMGGSKDGPTQAQKSEVYKKALKDYYGLDIEVPPGMTNTHFDKMFDMFGTVPKEHVKQDKMKKLKYDTADIGGLFYYADCKIEMGNFGDGTRVEDYEIGGKTVSANSFNVTALHEIGHSIDFKKGIMSTARMGKAGAGGWQQQDLASVTAGFQAELKKSVALSDNVTDDMLKLAVETALSAGTTTQPDTIEDDDWQKILPFLVGKCLPCRDAAQPYFKDSPIVVGTVVYTESSPGYWWSYASGSRSATKVNLYQWRSPQEWFAEVYAITWLKKNKPPSGVDAEIAAYCWK